MIWWFCCRQRRRRDWGDGEVRRCLAHPARRFFACHAIDAGCYVQCDVSESLGTPLIRWSGVVGAWRFHGRRKMPFYAQKNTVCAEEHCALSDWSCRGCKLGRAFAQFLISNLCNLKRKRAQVHTSHSFLLVRIGRRSSHHLRCALIRYCPIKRTVFFES